MPGVSDLAPRWRHEGTRTSQGSRIACIKEKAVRHHTQDTTGWFHIDLFFHLRYNVHSRKRRKRIHALKKQERCMAAASRRPARTGNVATGGDRSSSCSHWSGMPWAWAIFGDFPTSACATEEVNIWQYFALYDAFARQERPFTTTHVFIATRPTRYWRFAENKKNRFLTWGLCVLLLELERCSDWWSIIQSFYQEYLSKSF